MFKAAVSLKRFWILITIIFLGLSVYSNSFHCPFQFDGTEYIVKNLAIRDVTNIGNIWKAMSYPSRFVGFYSFALNYHFHQLDVFGYHIVNLIIHLINALLVWWLMKKTLLLDKSLRLKFSQKEWLAGFIAILFLVHPLQTQAVTYITQRFTSLAALFYLMGLCLYIKGRGVERHSFVYFTGSLVSAVLGMFTKQIVLTLPLMIVYYEFCFFRNSRLKKESNMVRLNVLMGVFLVLMLIVPGIYQFNVKGIIFNQLASRSHQGEMITAFTYLLTEFRVLVKYLSLFILPYNQNLLYDFELSKSLFEPATCISFLVLLGMFILCIRLIKSHRMISFGLGWFFITHLVESSIIPIRTVIFEHRMYLPSIGLCLVCGAIIFTIVKDERRAFIIMAILIVIFSHLTFQRNKVWKDEISLWQDAVLKSPNMSTPYLNLGVAYSHNGEYKRAKEYFEKVIVLMPDNIMAYNNMGNVYNKLGQKDQAIQLYHKVIELNPQQPGVYNNLGSAYYDLKEYDKAGSNFKKALQINPNDPHAYYNLGNVYGAGGDIQTAIEFTRQAIVIHPKFADAYYNLGIFHHQLGKSEMAIDAYKKTISIQPNYGAAHNNLAVIYYEQGKAGLARSHIGEALNIGYQPNKIFIELLKENEK